MRDRTSLLPLPCEGLVGSPGKKSEHLGPLAVRVTLVGFMEHCNSSECTGRGCPLIKIKLELLLNSYLRFM